MSDSAHPDGDLSQLSVADEIDLICDAFEDAWVRGEAPQIESYLVRSPPASRELLLTELLLVDREFRAKRGESFKRQDYEKCFPEYPSVIEKLALETIEDSTRRTASGIRQSKPPSQERHIAQFELLEELGTGASGSVWKARDAQLHRLVAVKIPRQGSLSGAERDRFRREGQASAQLRHPNIVTVYEVGEDDQRVFIVAELIDGMDLRQWLTSHRLNPRDAAQLMAPLAEALHHAHEQGVIHRDLKPANILVDRDGRPHITDFGLAKWCVDGEGMTLEGNILGTPAYMSPEQARGDANKVDRRSDVYSLGAVFYEMLSGEAPFVGAVAAVVHRVVHEEPRPLRSVKPRLPRDLVTICHKCLEKSPEDRYASAAELAVDVKHWLAGRPINARPASQLVRAWKWSRRNRLLVSAALAILLIGSVSIFTAVLQGRATADSAYREAQTTVSAWIVTPSTELRSGKDEIRRRQDLRPELEDRLRDPSLRAEQEMRLRLALLPSHPEHALWLAEYMVSRADVEEFGVLLEVLRTHARDIVPYLTQMAVSKNATANMQMRALIALCKYSDSGISAPEFEKVARSIANLRDAEEASKWPEFIADWKPEFEKCLHRLISDNTLSDSQRARACIAFVGLFKGQPEKLVELLPDATDEQHRILCDALTARAAEAVALIRRVFQRPERTLPNDDSWRAFEEAEMADEAEWRSQGNLACALVRLGAWPDVRERLLETPNDPRLQTYFVHQAASQGISHAEITRLLYSEPSPSARFALLLALGGYAPEKIANEDRASTMEWLQQAYRTDPHAGVHSAVRWLLRRWGEAEWVADADSHLIGPCLSNRDWYVNRLGMLMIKVRGTGQSINQTNFSHDGAFQKTITRATSVPWDFFISADEVSWEEFLKFDDTFVSPYRDKSEQSGHRATDFISGFDAAEFCRFLSALDGLSDEDQAVQLLDGRKQIGFDIRKVGYRLPMLSEWQVACSAGASTSRYYGTTATPFAEKYLHSDRDRHPQVIGGLIPNLYGGCDFLGNMRELVLDDALNTNELISIETKSVLTAMGGSFDVNSSRCNVLSTGKISAQLGYNVIGLRIARSCETLVRDGGGVIEK